MKKPLYILLILVVLVAIVSVIRFSGPEDTWICVDKEWVKHGNPDTTAPVSGCGDSQVELFFYNPKNDQGPGGAQCSRKGIVAVNRVVPKTATSLQDSIALLLRGGLSNEEKNQGITTEFPLEGFALKSADTNDGVVTLTFDDPQHKTNGGACRAGILWFQIEATTKQFPGVTYVKFMPEDLFQP
jgi:hypothetical protein